MTKTEMLKLIFTVKAAYPVYYRNVSQKELEAMADLWAGVLRGYGFGECFRALQGYWRAGNTEIIQSPGQIVKAVKEQEKRDSFRLPPELALIAEKNRRIMQRHEKDDNTG